MMDGVHRSRLAALLQEDRRPPAVVPMPVSPLARLAFSEPPDPITSLPAVPARQVLTATPAHNQTAAEMWQDQRRNLLAELLDHDSTFNRYAMGFLGPASTRFVRRSQSPTSPMNAGRADYAMFVETRNPRDTLDQLSGYGPAAWITRGDGATDIRTIQPAIVRALREAGAHQDLNTTAANLAREANPTNIVDSAGLWDNQNLVREVWDRVLEPRGITSVRTQDGLLIFDPSLARPIRVP